VSYKFGNDTIELKFDESSGVVKSILHKKSGLELIKEPRLAASFKLLMPLPNLRHNYLVGTEQKLTRFERAKNSCTLTWESLRNVNGKFDVHVRQTFELGHEENEIQVKISIKNESEHTVEEVWSPMLGGFHGIRNRKKTRFIASLWNGSFPGVGQATMERFPNDSPYWNEEFDYFELTYPWEMSMQWVDFYNDESNEGMYLGSHDQSTQVTFFHFELRPGMVQRDKLNLWPTSDDVEADTPIGMNCSIAKIPFIKPGEYWASAPACINFHKGDWHGAADRYRRWIDTWMKIAVRPKWLKEGVSWQGTVVNWPDDLVAYRFSEIPKLAEDAIKYQVNALHIDGFNHGGLDRGYPDYSPDPKLGSPEELSQGISRANQLGVKVLLFVNLQVADITTSQFEKELFRWSAKDRFGKERRFGYGMYTLAEKNKWGFRQLTYMCPSSKPFQNLIIKQFKDLARLGANGIQIDKLCDYGLCYDETHGHRPAEAFSRGVSESLKRISEECHKVDPEFLLAGEATFDFCWQYMSIAYMRLRDWDHVPVFKYTFPEALITVCVHQFDYQSVNNCLRVGYVINAEIHNMRASLASAPKLGAYIREILRIRAELIDYLWNGRFKDGLGATIGGDSKGILYGVHVNTKNERRAVVLMNTTDVTKRVRVALDDNLAMRYRIYAPFAESFLQSSSRRVTVKPRGVAVVVEA
jgi:Domain of unknown function (DUF6259)/Glycosyl hydrolases family 38 C-terminal domain